MNGYIIGLSTIYSFLNSCERKDENDQDIPSKEIPSTYNFENVSYGGQTDRLDMMNEMISEMKKARSGTKVDGQKLIDMFSNESAPFSSDQSKDLKSKCFEGGTDGVYDATTYEYLLNYYGEITAAATGKYSPNNAGIATTKTGSKYFFDAYGVDYTRLIERGLIGAVFYYQVVEIYTRDVKIGDDVDNVTITPGKGTDMEHHWDEAFGYFGVPTDLTVDNFDSKKSDGEVRYYGKYANFGQSAGLNTVEKVMNEFIKGRFGISNNNYTMRNNAAIQLRAEWEIVIATAAIHYLNDAQDGFSDVAARNYDLSTALGFIMSLHYNSDNLMTSANINIILDYFRVDPPSGATPEEGAPNKIFSLLNVTEQNIIDAKTMISNAYNFCVKDSL